MRQFAPITSAAAVLITLLLASCIDQIEPQTIGEFESALVIEASITDEFKRQKISLSRAFKFEDEGPFPESNANIQVMDDSGNSYLFEETEAGIYISTMDFAALPNRAYQLKITTKSGSSYSSETLRLPSETKIDSLYAERITTDLGIEGVAIMVDTFNPTGTSRNYRYTYEETYKIIVPNWVPIDLIVTNSFPAQLILGVRPVEEQICYNTVLSTDIIQAETNDLEEDRLNGFVVRFIQRDNFIISHRYSVLVKQFVQSEKAFAFFETLKDFSDSESLFSAIQPGFLGANIFADDDSNEKVLGYFDVVSTDERRIFFDYEDFFPNEALPPFLNACLPTSPPGGELIGQVSANTVKYIDENPNPNILQGPYFVVPRPCGDCTALGVPEIPDFWIE